MSNVLIIDDSPILRAKVRTFIETFGFNATEAGNGKEALDTIKASSHNFDLILCDVNMPVMDGIEFCRNYSSDDSINKSPIFLLTTEASPDLKKRAREYGVRVWLTKPFAPDMLQQAITHVLGKAAS